MVSFLLCVFFFFRSRETFARATYDFPESPPWPTLPPNALSSVTGMPRRPPNLSYAGNRRHSRNHARTNLNGRYLFASVPIGLLLGLWLVKDDVLATLTGRPAAR